MRTVPCSGVTRSMHSAVLDERAPAPLPLRARAPPRSLSAEADGVCGVLSTEKLVLMVTFMPGTPSTWCCVALTLGNGLMVWLQKPRVCSHSQPPSQPSEKAAGRTVRKKERWAMWPHWEDAESGMAMESGAMGASAGANERCCLVPPAGAVETWAAATERCSDPAARIGSSALRQPSLATPPTPSSTSFHPATERTGSSRAERHCSSCSCSSAGIATVSAGGRAL
mmetsp:Transcript_53075/g.119094  ORF Transcript_53075/g.119094 Transcript_53075/m.119094 type:complete len:226 (+) Transcript_53075:392-1069(+)